MKYNIEFRLNETGNTMNFEGKTFIEAVCQMLNEFQAQYGWKNPWDGYDIFEALFEISNPFGDGHLKPYRRFDFSTPEDNFTLTVTEKE